MPINWDQLETKPCKEVEGDAKILLKPGQQLTFSIRDDLLFARPDGTHGEAAWTTMLSKTYVLAEVPELTLPPGVRATGDVSVGQIVITDSHHDQEPHVLLQVVGEHPQDGPQLYGLLRSIKTLYDAGPGPRSHNGYYHFPL